MSVTLNIQNKYSSKKTFYMRYHDGHGLTDENGVDVPSELSGSKGGIPITINANKSKKFTLGESGKIISGIIWMDTTGRGWNKGAPDKSGPQCSLLEFTIDDERVSYDISAVEGLCGGYEMKWTPDSGPAKPENTVVCKPKPSGKHKGKYIPSDKWIQSHSDNDRELAGCGGDKYDKRTGKPKCHEWIQKNSYTKGGYCQWLYDNKCQGYCWAYDEMKCSKPPCVYDKEGNPCKGPLDNDTCVTDSKKVDGSPTNPSPNREKGELLLVFQPLSGGSSSGGDNITNDIVIGDTIIRIIVLAFIVCYFGSLIYYNPM
jgi:hypothetical protein